ncbi:tetraspanin-8-like [Epinephelus lanceolatus]|uniref:tetraspanin-8-like n=1 Tax=Epinephelus lanceolatus TaxID=310571 RepID=UPI001444B6E5|nr:tetraspanin-8-like [Epinephelus lanceolatus]
MGKVNVCVKWSYITVISLIGIACVLLLAATLFTHGYVHRDEKVNEAMAILHTLYIFSIITLILTIIGLYGACKEKKWALIVFAVGLILSSLFMLVNLIYGLAMQPKMVEEMKKQYLKMLPLNNASEIFVEIFKDTQMEYQCCGLDKGYLDWGYNISESCLCTQESTRPCVAAPKDSSLYEHRVDDQPIMVYEESCLPYLIAGMMTAMNIGFGINLAITSFWVLSVVLCIIILCQLYKKEDTPAVVYSQEAKAGNYTVLIHPAEDT